MRDQDRFRSAVAVWAAGGPDAPAAARVARELAGDGLATVVLVEGVSDRSAVEALAARRGRDLVGEGVCVLSIGGAMSVARFLRLFGPQGLAIKVRGLCDEAEEGYFRRGLEQAGLGTGLTRSAMEALGFYVCVADLEDELIRALGTVGVESVFAAERDLDRFRLFQNQPAQRGRAIERQLRRFMGTTSGRKSRYARALVHALDPNRIPRPLDQLLPGR
ncbi:ATP-dependent endonuclease [Micromonospora sp. NBC_01699]|uniref:TOPRIM nucleotidyl transferase/hydrolase domain-containing protein n=1 Tax=Micromonospora sp. NBC_01699 TaxID=2975984 RepID=UPI002E35E369|nr:TOPRIM nucleotidyl transferase/hydrolase domain-containing protein [Micromonospora sp. NBC_01699]